MIEKTAIEYMMEFQEKYPDAGRDELLRKLCTAIREETVKEVQALNLRQLRPFASGLPF